MATVAKTIRWGAGSAGVPTEMFYNVFGRDETGTYRELVARANSGVAEERPKNYKVTIAAWDSRWRDWVVYWDHNDANDAMIAEQATLADMHHVAGKPASPANGAGANAVTVTVTSSVGGAAVVGATVRLTDGAGSWTATTNASGVAGFNLDVSTFTLAITKAGFSFVAASRIVDGAEAFAETMAPIVFAAPANPEQTNAYLITLDGAGSPKAGVEIWFRLVNPAGAGTNAAFDRRNFKGTSDGAGLLQVSLLKSSSYEAWHEKQKTPVQFTTDANGTFALPEILSDYGS